MVERRRFEALMALRGPTGRPRPARQTERLNLSEPMHVHFRHILDKYLYTINCINKSPGEGKLFRGVSITDFTGR